MKGIIDFHTHIFPDALAKKAITALEKEGKISAQLDGTLSSLIKSMEDNGIEKSVVCSIATKPSQFSPILEWSKTLRSEQIIPLPSIHPDDPQVAERIELLHKEGFIGFKMHPYYQDFVLDQHKMFKIYEKTSYYNLLLVMHTGFDFAFERIRKADPEKIIRIIKEFPSLKLILTHLGAWEDWDNVEKLIIGKNIYMEISFSLEFLNKQQARRIFLNHPKEYILFGTDSPWTSQSKTLKLLKELSLGEERENLLLRKNAISLLNSVRN